MKLYVIPVSPNCRQAEAVVHHLGLDTEIVTLDMRSGAMKQDDFLAMNPNGRVPALRDGDFTLWESRAIMQYLADKSGAAMFFPTDPARRADIARWMYWEALHYNRALGTILWETVAKRVLELGEPDESEIAAGTEAFHEFAPILNDQLDGKRFITGDDVTLADFAVGSHAGLVASPQSRVPLAQYPNIAAWHDRLDALPAWQKTKPPIRL